MKIISKIKDYYDYVGKIYGEDEKVPYNRLDLNKDEYRDITIPAPFKSRDQQLHNMRSNISGKHIHQLIVCGHVFTVEKETYTNDPYKLLSEETIDLLSKDDSTYRYFRRNHKDNYYKGEFLEEAKTMCKLVGHPVIVYTGRDHADNLTFWRRIPNLGEAGVPAFFKPEEMFQMIQQFISNEIRENPDTQPPVEVEDKYKIIGHGFDLKTSFRHRKQE